MREEGGTGDKWEGGVVVINLLHRLLSTRTQLAHPVLKSIKPPNHSFIHSRREAFDFSNSYSLEIVTRFTMRSRVSRCEWKALILSVYPVRKEEQKSNPNFVLSLPFT